MMGGGQSMMGGGQSMMGGGQGMMGGGQGMMGGGQGQSQGMSQGFLFGPSTLSPPSSLDATSFSATGTNNLNSGDSSSAKCPPCPACARCPEPSFECKKVPNYNTIDNDSLPQPVLNNFSGFGM